MEGYGVAGEVAERAVEVLHSHESEDHPVLGQRALHSDRQTDLFTAYRMSEHQRKQLLGDLLNHVVLEPIACAASAVGVDLKCQVFVFAAAV